MEKIKIVRYSNSGFEPCYQSQMKETYNYYMNFSESVLPDGLTEYSKNLIIGTAIKIKGDLDHDFSFQGIHVFIGEPREDIRDFQLNHIKGAKPIRNETYIDVSIPCRSLCDPFTLSSIYPSLKKAIEKGHYGVFIEAKYLQELF